MPPVVEVPGSLAGRFRLIERLGGPRSGAWKAEDPERQRFVTIRILTRSLPPDSARRAALLERVQQRAAFHHPAFPEIEAIAIDGEALVLREELIEAPSLSTVPKPLDTGELLKLAWQVADALRTLHARRIVHGALDPDHILVATDGSFRLTGVSLAALTAREDRGEERLLRSSDPPDLRELSFRSPEQISARGSEIRSDVFSLGAVLFDAATGRAPFGGTTPTDVATAVLRGFPPSPLELNPRLPINLIALIGKCLMKDPVKRFQDMQQIVDELRRIEPKIEILAARASSQAQAPRTAPRTFETPFIVGTLPYFDLLEREEGEKASRLAALMQQTLGEAALLGDGTILDSLGARFIATLPSADAALGALRRAAAEIDEQNAGGAAAERLEPTVLAHAGQITIGPGSPAGAALDLAGRVLSSMEPGQMLLTGAIAAAAGLGGARPLGSVEGVELFALPPREPEPATAGPEPEEAPLPPAPAKKSRRIVWLGAAAALFLAAIAALLLWPREKAAPPPAAVPASSTAPGDARPQLVLEPFSVDGTDPDITARAAAMEEAVRAMLASSPDLRLLDQPAGDAARFATRSVPGGSRDQITVYSLTGGLGESGPLSIEDPASATAIAAWIAEKSGVAPERIAKSNPEALAAFIEALAEKRSRAAGSAERSAAAIRKALQSDPDFLPVARAAVSILSEAGDRPGATAAAETVVRLDPKDAATSRLLFDWSRETADKPLAIRNGAALLRTGHADSDVLVFLAREALGAGDAEAFQRFLTRLQRSAGRAPLPLHAADATAARGQLGVAVQQYYALEPTERANPFLALKIARIDVLRHSIPAAELELEKLRLLDPAYSAELLEAYLAAEKRDAASAAASLARAGRAPNRAPDFHTAEAEVYAILNDHRGILAALGRAVEAREPTYAYVLANPLFAYLREEPEFDRLRAAMEKAQQELRAALEATR